MPSYPAAQKRPGPRPVFPIPGEQKMNSIRKVMSACVGAMVLLQTVTASAALDAALKVQGSKQGTFKGNSRRDPNSAIVVKFTHGVTSPRDFNKRTANGETIHEPIVVTLKLDGTTRPQWLTAQKANETLSTVAISVYKAGADGKASPYYTIELKNALIEKIDVVQTAAADEVLPQTSDGTSTAYLRVAFTYQKITTTWVEGGKTATDDWLAN
jgi:type VI secretion system secreted protein Hcp